jgi:hypothetical protein
MAQTTAIPITGANMKLPAILALAPEAFVPVDAADEEDDVDELALPNVTGGEVWLDVVTGTLVVLAHSVAHAHIPPDVVPVGRLIEKSCALLEHADVDAESFSKPAVIIICAWCALTYGLFSAVDVVSVPTVRLHRPSWSGIVSPVPLPSSQ